nr:MAG TPA: hypothetical protein [Caudoviricetes sp.]
MQPFLFNHTFYFITLSYFYCYFSSIHFVFPCRP